MNRGGLRWGASHSNKRTGNTLPGCSRTSCTLGAPSPAQIQGWNEGRERWTKKLGLHHITLSCLPAPQLQGPVSLAWLRLFRGTSRGVRRKKTPYSGPGNPGRSRWVWVGSWTVPGNGSSCEGVRRARWERAAAKGWRGPLPPLSPARKKRGPREPGRAATTALSAREGRSSAPGGEGRRRRREEERRRQRVREGWSARERAES